MFYVYILASRRNGTLYIGMTNDLARRVFEHREGAIPGFTTKYGVKRLVWFEVHETPGQAMQREKSLKRWNRAWKLALIETTNPDGTIYTKRWSHEAWMPGSSPGKADDE